MKLNPENAEKLWDEFLQKWPLETLSSLQIEQYTKAGDSNTFTNWLEGRTEDLGSIWGGSAFKFGIYHRADDQAKKSEGGLMYGDIYAWYAKYGKAPEEAFKAVLTEVVKVAEAARAGDLHAIENADLGQAVKWKIAFLYQDRAALSILPIYKLEVLRALAHTTNPRPSYTELYAQLMQSRGDKSPFKYASELWAKWEATLPKKLTQEDALDYLQNRFQLLREPVKYMAAFSTDTERQIGLVRTGSKVTVFVEPGDWPSLAPGLSLNRRYGKDEPRIHSLDAHAPRLYVGFSADNLYVPTMEALTALCDAYEGTLSTVEHHDETGPQPPLTDEPPQSMNIILYGPPGTGKTYKTAERAVEICDGYSGQPRQELMKRYKALRKEGRISFVTFHQSYGYEDFVEGLRPESKDGQVTYRVRPGVFREVCDAARRSTLVKPGLQGKPLQERTVYKMSFGIAGTTEGNHVFQECITNGYALLGWGNNVDFSECTTVAEIRKKLEDEHLDVEKLDSQVRFVSTFKNEVKNGDLIVASQGNKAFRAIGEVIGDYEYLEAGAAGTYHQMRPVRWLAVFEGNRPVDDIYEKNFQQSTLYRLDNDAIKFDALEDLISDRQENGDQAFVLIIDEINRANISKVFGELITLLEPDKREGEGNALTVKLPYSGDEFSVPSNLYVVGTMNTADRSIALLDTALRRRFEFEELQPSPETLQQASIEGIDLMAMLQALNERVEYLYDRDHTIGHAYFINVRTLDDLEAAFRRKVIPLLQEYFYEDWAKVRLALNDQSGQFIESIESIPKGLENTADGYEARPRYRVRKGPFSLDAYLNIYR
jgi:5-methylcytosine-specific restriction protein B